MVSVSLPSLQSVATFYYDFGHDSMNICISTTWSCINYNIAAISDQCSLVTNRSNFSGSGVYFNQAEEVCCHLKVTLTRMNKIAAHVASKTAMGKKSKLVYRESK